MPDRGNVVHVMGTGTIGEPLIGLLTDHRKELGIDQVTFYKHTPRPDDRAKVRQLIERGAVMAARDDKRKDFEELGLQPQLDVEEALDQATVVVDAAPGGAGLENKETLYLPRADSTAGFLAQGSELGFGKMYALGINDAALTPDDQFIHVVSCNTHNIAVILKVLGIPDAGAEGSPQPTSRIKSGRFVCVRRGSDVTDTKKSLAAPKVTLHDSERGTHHAHDVHALYETLGLDLDVFSSAMKVNTQYMHTIWFDVELTDALSHDEVVEAFRSTPRVATTEKTLSSVVFAFGRDHGYFGRFLDQTVVCLPSLHVRDREVYGFCFTPQDGNSILSSAAGVLRFLHPEDYLEKVEVFDRYLFHEV